LRVNKWSFFVVPQMDNNTMVGNIASYECQGSFFSHQEDECLKGDSIRDPI